MDKCVVHVHESGHTGGDMALNLAARYAERIVELLKNELTDSIESEGSTRTENDAALEAKIENIAEEIKNIVVGTSEIANGAVTSEKIADKSVTTSKISDYSVGQNQLAQGAVSNNRLQNGSVDSRVIADNAVITSKIVDNAVTADKIADNAVTSLKIKDGSVTGVKLAPGAVDTDELAIQSVTNEKLVPGATVKNVEIHSWEDIEELAPGLYSCGVTSNYTIPFEPYGMFIVSCSELDAKVHIFVPSTSSNNNADIYLLDTGNHTYTEVCRTNTKYSTTPVQIGTWIDGTPVWRYAFDMDFDEMIESDLSVCINIPVTNLNNCFALDAYASAKYNSKQCVLDDVPLERELGKQISFTVPSTIAQNYIGYYGYVDFVTSESNLKS